MTDDEFVVRFTAYGREITPTFVEEEYATRFADDMDRFYDDVRVQLGGNSGTVIYVPALWDDGFPVWCGDYGCRFCQGHERGPPQAEPCPSLKSDYTEEVSDDA